MMPAHAQAHISLKNFLKAGQSLLTESLNLRGVGERLSIAEGTRIYLKMRRADKKMLSH